MRNRKIWKWLVGVIISTALVVPAPVVSAENEQRIGEAEEAADSARNWLSDKDGFLIDENGTLQSYGGTSTELTIPNTVKKIGSYAFYRQESIKSITIPNTVTYISNNAFEGCSGLEEITIPGTVTQIEREAFLDCTSLPKIHLPDNLEIIDYGAFKGCSKLTEVNIPNKLKKINNDMFYGCSSLLKIDIPDNVTEIESNAFYNCSKLAEVNLPIGLTEINSYIFNGCSDLQKITLPDSVSLISYKAFSGCANLAEINIPANVTEIQNSAFDGCNSLTKITVSKNNSIYTAVEGIIYNKEKTAIVAYPSAKENITIPNGITAIGGAFSGCSALKSIHIPDTVTVIGENAFLNCKNLAEITIPDTVTEISASAFAGCSNLIEITIPSEVKRIKSYTFAGCSSLKTVNIADANVIENGAFQDCSNLKEIKLPEQLREIKELAFYGCSSLVKIDIPIYVNEISNKVFLDCSNLIQINVAEENEQYMSEDGCLYNKEQTVLYVCPEGKTEINIPDTVMYIGDYACYDCSKLVEIKIPWSVTSIGVSAFSGCEGLTSISLSENIEYICDFAFLSCVNLKTINIPSGVTAIPNWTFMECKSLENVSIAAEQISFGDKAFYGCSSLTGISFQGEIWRIGSEVFKGCTNLTFYGKEGSNISEHAKLERVQFSAQEIPWTVSSDISVCRILLNPESFQYNGKAQTPDVYLENGKISLEKDTDYTITYKNNINIGTGQVIITGIGNYTGTITKEFTITGNQDTGITNPKTKELSNCQIAITPTSYTYDGTAKTPLVTVKDGTVTLKAGTDYNTEYRDNIKVGTGKAILRGMGNYKGTVTKTFTIQNAPQNDSDSGSQNNSNNSSQTGSKNLTCAKTIYKKVYGNKPFSLGISLKDERGALTCTSSNKKVLTVTNKGKATIKGTGIAVITAKVGAVGKYSAESVRITVEVSPKKQIVKSLKTTKGKKLKVSWKKDRKATGYQVQYSMDKNFKKGTKTVKIAKNKTISKTISKLKTGKKYYVRVRSYKNAKIDGKSKKLYSAWSSRKRSGSIKK